jgi:tRNA isopentenyl-2-thiomethyl-A-37 hydroxylase MiaE
MEIMAMNKPKRNTVDIKKLIKKNPNVNAEELAHNFEVLKELQKRGVKIGPNYTLGSPFSRPRLHNK